MNKIVLKNSSVPGAIPRPDDLVLGEVAINIADGRLYTRRGDQVVSLAQSVDLRAFGRITGDVGYIEPENPQEPMTLKGGSGLKVTAMHATKDIRIDLDNADAATLGGHAAIYFATADHLHDDRYVLKSESGGDYYTQAQVDANIQQAIDDLINGAGSAYDTLKELEAALLDNDSDIAAINSAIATKLDASAYTAEDVLAKLKTVTGDGSGLDADTLNGNNGSFYRNASNLNAGTVPVARLSGIYDVGISGNAATASKFASAITLTLSGDASGSVTLDGSGDVTLNAAVKNDSHTHDTRYYTKTQSDERFFLLDNVATQEEVLSESSSSVVNVDGLWAAIRKYGLGGSGRKVSTNHDVFDVDLITDSGFYGLFGSAENTFPGQQSGDTMIHARWGTNHQSQIGIGQSNQMFFRYQNDGVWRSWNKVWHDNNMGADSGLDADKVDGLQATQFVRTDADSIINAGADTTLSIQASDSGNATLAIHGENQGTGRVYVGQDGLYGGGLEYNGDGAPETSGAGVDCLTLWRRANGEDHWTARNKYSSDVWEFKVAPTVGEHQVWHAGNTGEFTINGQDFRGRGKRCIVASTSAMFLNYAGDFTNVTIQSDAVISGILTANDHLRSGAMNFSTYKEWDTGEFNALGGGAAIVNDSTGHKGLMILGNRSAGGNRIVKVWDELQCMGDVKAYASDARLKTNVQTIDSALDKLSRIRGVTYDWIEDCKDLGFCPANPHEHGVIAQEIESVIPDAVSSAPFNENYLTVRYDRIVPLLIEALKEEAALREQLQRRVQMLESSQEAA